MEIELIKANDFSEGSARKRVERLRVAAYCRVSTDDDDQIKRNLLEKTLALSDINI